VKKVQRKKLSGIFDFMTGSWLFYGEKTILGFLSIAPVFVRCALSRRSCPEAADQPLLGRPRHPWRGLGARPVFYGTHS
jgi:hypothetical protein